MIYINFFSKMWLQMKHVKAIIWVENLNCEFYFISLVCVYNMCVNYRSRIVRTLLCYMWS